MGQSAGHDGKLGPPGPDRARFVADLATCVADWKRSLSGPAPPGDATLFALTQRSMALEQHSGPLGFGGIGHHLRELLGLSGRRADLGALRAQLGVVEDLLVAARGVLSPEEAARASSPPPGMMAPNGGMAPPPLITVGGARGAMSPPAAGAPAPMPSAPPGMGAGGPTPPRLLFDSQLKARAGAPMAAAPQVAPAPVARGSNSPVAPMPPILGGSPSAEPPMSAPGGLAPMPVAPARLQGGGSSGVRPAQPNLFVRSVLGLRAFGRKGAPGPQSPAEPQALEPPAQAGPSKLLGLKTGPTPRAPAPPPMLAGHAGLPSLPLGSDAHAPLGPDPFAGRGRKSDRELRSRNSDRDFRNRNSEPPARGRMSDAPARGRGRSRRPEQGDSRWWIGVFAVAGVGIVVGLIVVIAVLLSRRGESSETAAKTPDSSGSAAIPSGSSAPIADGQAGLPRSRLTNDNERLRALLQQVHGQGKESAELRALVDELASQVVQGECRGAECAARGRAQQNLLGDGTRKVVRRRSRSPDALRSKWLAGLEMPEIDVEDDPRVQKRFEFYTENPLGRETFQQMLFRCGAFKDSIQATLIRHGMPAALLAVVFAESGCSPLAKSPVGAEGLWQFIPSAARAYHLRVIEDVVDERHSPQKSTEAAVRFLGDMYAKLGSWDLVFAGYNMGPFGIAARLQMVEGENVGFWDLVDAGLLPDETADYAPSIQAIALILNNLQRLKFTGIQMRAPQVTMDLEVPPSTRMSLVARAAALSMNELRTMNLDIKGAVTPGVPNFAVQVPKDNVWQARETLQELLKSKDESDQCVPSNFDWGRQRFTAEMAQACGRTLAAQPAATGAAAPEAPATP